LILLGEEADEDEALGLAQLRVAEIQEAIQEVIQLQHAASALPTQPANLQLGFRGGLRDA
jgi:hypothetical protein